jgi:circadian clock protein KaiB
MTPSPDPDLRLEGDDGTNPPLYELTLFVSVGSERSNRAIANARELCDVHLEGRYRLTVVDINVDATAASENAILAVPTLVRTEPLPRRAFIGDLSHLERVLTLLKLPADSHAVAPASG